jgi:phosphoenolpyruvate synthase/pyruvate phosphate dikinase
MSLYVVPLASAAGAPAVGGKGASLGDLVRAGIPVPPGFAVTTGGFAAALDAIDPAGASRAEIEALPAGDLPLIARVTAAFRDLIARAPLPASVASAIESAYAALGGDSPDVAVRSSATMEDSSAASFAGLQDTYLGVAGAESMLEHVRRCWASLYNDESVAYRRRLGMDEAGVAMAVVVQRMVRPRAAGVMFTRSPVTGDRSVVAIEATWGLGSALVSGDVTPDSFVISKITGEITGRRISSKGRMHSYIPNGLGVSVADTPPDLRDRACLTDDEIRALAAIGRRVEAHYGTPQDIEWAVLDEDGQAAPAAEASPDPAAPDPAATAAGRIVLLQSRPETVWAARASAPVAAPKPRAADHVLALFGKPL